MLLLQDNTHVHTTHVVVIEAANRGFKMFLHAPCLPDLASSDGFLKLESRHFASHPCCRGMFGDPGCSLLMWNEHWPTKCTDVRRGNNASATFSCWDFCVRSNTFWITLVHMLYFHHGHFLEILKQYMKDNWKACTRNRTISLKTTFYELHTFHRKRRWIRNIRPTTTKLQTTKMSVTGRKMSQSWFYLSPVCRGLFGAWWTPGSQVRASG